VAEAEDGSVMRRKIAAGMADRGDGVPGADRGWRLALARAARDQLKLPLEVNSLSLTQLSLAELLELPPERALIALLQGPADGVGLLVLAPAALAAMIEVQTVGRVGSTPLAPRRPTRTDAAMVAEMLDAALCGLEDVLAEEADLIWAGGFRYASFLDDPRPLGLLLEDIPYKLLHAQVTLGQGNRAGGVLLALPAEGRGARPRVTASAALAEAQAGPAFAEALAAQIETAEAILDAVLSRVSLPLARVLDLKVGEVLTLPRASIDRLCFVGLDGRSLSEGRLGQQRGMRAIRLMAPEVAVKASGQAPQATVQPVTTSAIAAEPLRQSA
jgi:flagellar motor switch protein FliM